MNNRLLYFVCAAILLGRVASAQSTAPAPDEFALREWGVFVLDASQNKLNPDGVVTSTLPEFVEAHRLPAGKESLRIPFPVCVIHLIGQSDTKVDVVVGRSDGSFMASWPKAQTRIKQLLWRNLSLTDKPGAAGLQAVAEENWFTLLRAGPAAYLTGQEGSSERFLLYDVEMPYTCPLSVRSAKDFSVEYQNTSQLTLHDLTFYRPDQDGFRHADVGDLAPQPPATRPTTRKSFPTTRKTQLIASPSTRPSDLAADWRQKLLDRGLVDTDCDVILQVLAANAFDPRRLTAVYFLEPSEFDRLLPLEVLPEPRKINRVAIVIIKNADLAAGTEIDDLITQLGDPVWARRAEAYDALNKLGAVALPKLQAALQNQDIEIVWRAERLIAQAQKPAGAP